MQLLYNIVVCEQYHLILKLIALEVLVIIWCTIVNYQLCMSAKFIWSCLCLHILLQQFSAPWHGTVVSLWIGCSRIKCATNVKVFKWCTPAVNTHAILNPRAHFPCLIGGIHFMCSTSATTQHQVGYIWKAVTSSEYSTHNDAKLLHYIPK